MSIIKIDLAKAKEMHRERIRHARKPLLEELDVEFTRALEDGVDTKAIVDKKKAQLDDMLAKKEEIVKFNAQIKKSKSQIKKIRPEYENFSTLFHSKAEVEGLYQTLSEYA